MVILNSAIDKEELPVIEEAVMTKKPATFVRRQSNQTLTNYYDAFLDRI